MCQACRWRIRANGPQIAILEAMKLEIAVRLPEDVGAESDRTAKVEKLLVRPGDTIKAGGRIALVRSQ